MLTQFYSAHLKQEKSTNAIFNLLVNYARPRSRGSIKLKSNNFRDDPIIDPNYFSVKQDLEILVEGLKIGYEIGESAPSFKKLKAQLNPTPWPKCSGILFKLVIYKLKIDLGNFSVKIADLTNTLNVWQKNLR